MNPSLALVLMTVIVILVGGGATFVMKLWNSPKPEDKTLRNWAYASIVAGLFLTFIFAESLGAISAEGLQPDEDYRPSTKETTGTVTTAPVLEVAPDTRVVDQQIKTHQAIDDTINRR